MNQPQENSKLVTWCGYLGLTFLAALPLSVLIVRSGLWQQGLLLYALSCVGALVLLALLLILLLLPGFKRWRSEMLKRGLLVLPGSLLFIALIAGRGDIPPIHDITTDTIDPPIFSAADTVRAGSPNSLAIEPDTITQQLEAYPELATIRNGDSVEDNFDRALSTAQAMGWQVFHSDRDTGAIEATETTALMAFKDDIVIRIRADGGETLVDLRSVSRVGVSDLGANAKRIASFQERFRR
jgi:uncharacterized protein (DUF1499 family)